MTAVDMSVLQILYDMDMDFHRRVLCMGMSTTCRPGSRYELGER